MFIRFDFTVADSVAASDSIVDSAADSEEVLPADFMAEWAAIGKLLS
jgi:hypothetical protein